MIHISTKIISPLEEVEDFLKNLKSILTDKKFNASVDLDILNKKKSEAPTDPHTTANTLLALSFDRNDVVHQLLNLDVTDYIETFIDDKEASLPPFYTFGKDIVSREVYIKVKIRDRKNRKIFCVSFHFARYPLLSRRPYM